MIKFPSDFDKILENSYIVLDTNILIGFGLEKSFHKELIEKLTSLGSSFITLDLCINELFKGSSKLDDLNAREEIIKILDLTVLNSFGLRAEYKKILLSYRKSSSQIDITDLFLAAILLKYHKIGNVYLLTEDIKDFPKSIFEREYTFCIDNGEALKPVMLCKLNIKNFNKSIKDNE